MGDQLQELTPTPGGLARLPLAFPQEALLPSTYVQGLAQPEETTRGDMGEKGEHESTAGSTRRH